MEYSIELLVPAARAAVHRLKGRGVAQSGSANAPTEGCASTARRWEAPRAGSGRGRIPPQRTPSCPQACSSTYTYTIVPSRTHLIQKNNPNSLFKVTATTRIHTSHYGKTAAQYALSSPGLEELITQPCHSALETPGCAAFTVQE
jgi:hypothetical protein